MSEPENPPRLFLSYTRKDSANVKELYQKLKQAGYDPWMDIEDILPGQDWEDVEEKGEATHTHKISRDGLQAISDYLKHERKQDNEHFADAPAFFLPAATVASSDGRLTPLVINDVWSEVCKAADDQDRALHSARHAMGRYII